MIITLLFLELLLDLARAQWGFNPFGGPGPVPPYPPGNNIGVGYPTAYGLWFGRGNWANSLASTIRCLNGGALIGQCRIDDDAICMALGGTCIQRGCCTTPFLGLTTTTTTTVAPEIDGEATRKESEYHTRLPPLVEGSVERKNNLLEIEELLRIMENMKTSISPTPVEAFKLCLPSDGVCVTDDDCTTSRRCKEGCCYEE
ncbi:hypothetical protein V3C99_014836 [Haemonchus contortus]|uniref:WAP domain-containing protein n=1 Tax=Haemonchus contortus TaxID=6289 RepID=A0A912MXA8_HAECO|nr:Hypothetical protein CBG05620 [Haemonchus contortus]